MQKCLLILAGALSSVVMAAEPENHQLPDVIKPFATIDTNTPVVHDNSAGKNSNISELTAKVESLHVIPASNHLTGVDQYDSNNEKNWHNCGFPNCDNGEEMGYNVSSGNNNSQYSFGYPDQRSSSKMEFGRSTATST